MTALGRACRELASYGYSVTPRGLVLRPDGVSAGVVVKQASTGRVQIRSASSRSLIWSGSPYDIGVFAARYWYAERVDSTVATGVES